MKSLISAAGSDRMLFNLSPEERSNPLAVLEMFCNEYTPGKIREILHDDFMALLLNDKYNNIQERETLISRFEITLKLVEACYVIAAAQAGQGLIAA